MTKLDVVPALDKFQFKLWPGIGTRGLLTRDCDWYTARKKQFKFVFPIDQLGFIQFIRIQLSVIVCWTCFWRYQLHSHHRRYWVWRMVSSGWRRTQGLSWLELKKPHPWYRCTISHITRFRKTIVFRRSSVLLWHWCQCSHITRQEWLCQPTTTIMPQNCERRRRIINQCHRNWRYQASNRWT